MKNLLFILGFILFNLSLFATTDYVAPSIYRQNFYTVELKDIVSDKGEFKFAFTIENKSNDKFLVFELSKIAVAFSETDIYYPKNDEIVVVNPGSKERRTVKVISNGNFEVDKVNIAFPRMQVNGAQIDFTHTNNFDTKAEQSMNIGSYATATLSGLAFKKDVWDGEIEIKTNTFEGMLVLDLTKVVGLNSANASIPIQFKRDKNLNVALISNDQFKSKFSIADVGSTIKNIQLAGAFKMYSFSQLEIPEITIKKVGYVEPVKVETKNVNLCESFTASNGLPVKITIFNPNGICFKMASNGKKINDNMCSHVEFDCEYGTTVLTISLSNGQTITDKIYPSEGDVYIVYEIIERKGEWRLNRKLDLSGDARKVETKLPYTVTCKDQITLDVEGIQIIRNITVNKITKDRIYYADCTTNTDKSISKMEVLAVEYPNGYYDKFDFPGNGAKQNMFLERSELEIIELRNSNKTSSSFLVGSKR